MQKNETGPLFYSTHTQILTQEIKDLNVDSKTVTFPEGKILDSGPRNDFWDLTPKEKTTKTTTNN